MTTPEKNYQCNSCGHIGPAVKKFNGKIYVFIPLLVIFALLVLVLLFVHPIVALIVGGIGYFLSRKNHCSACGSDDIVRFYLEAEKEQERVKQEELAKYAAERESAKFEKMQRKEQKQAFIDEMNSSSNRKPLKVEVLGGAGWESKIGSTLYLTVSEHSVNLYDKTEPKKVILPVDEILNAEIGGHDRTYSSAGVSGGGFGVEGALTGMAIATAINLVTSRSDVKTIIRLATCNTEIVLLSKEIEPDDARLVLSTVYLHLMKKPGAEVPITEIAGTNPVAIMPQSFEATTRPKPSLSDEIKRLHGLMAEGVLTQSEVEAAKSKLLS